MLAAHVKRTFFASAVVVNEEGASHYTCLRKWDAFREAGLAYRVKSRTSVCKEELPDGVAGCYDRFFQPAGITYR